MLNWQLLLTTRYRRIMRQQHTSFTTSYSHVYRVTIPVLGLPIDEVMHSSWICEYWILECSVVSSMHLIGPLQISNIHRDLVDRRKLSTCRDLQFLQVNKSELHYHVLHCVWCHQSSSLKIEAFKVEKKANSCLHTKCMFFILREYYSWRW